MDDDRVVAHYMDAKLHSIQVMYQSHSSFTLASKSGKIQTRVRQDARLLSDVTSMFKLRSKLRDVLSIRHFHIANLRVKAGGKLNSQ